MYLRYTTIHEDGKSHTCWRPERSVRVGSGVPQQIVAMLGELDVADRAKARALADHIRHG